MRYTKRIKTTRLKIQHQFLPSTSFIESHEAQKLAFCVSVRLWRTTVTKHLMMSWQQYHAQIQKHVSNTRHAYKASVMRYVAPLEIHQRRLSSTSYNSQLQLCTFTVPFHFPFYCSIPFSIPPFHYILEKPLFIVHFWLPMNKEQATMINIHQNPSI